MVLRELTSDSMLGIGLFKNRLLDVQQKSISVRKVTTAFYQVVRSR